jgi:hypothetical protein
VEITCHERTRIGDGTQKLGECRESVGNYIHPVCNHEVGNLTCKQRRDFEECPPNCLHKMNFTRPCGCSVDMECKKVIEEWSTPSLCKCDIKTKRPRCNHLLSMRCHISSALITAWSSQDGLSARVVKGKSIVETGVCYGPAESSWMPDIPKCMVSVSYELPCGHYIADVPCDVAFRYANGTITAPACKFPIDVQSPVCSHVIQIFCSQRDVLDAWKPSQSIIIAHEGDAIFIREDSINVADWSSIPKSLRESLKVACQKSVSLIRNCDSTHVIEMSCSNTFDLILHNTAFKPCKVLVNRALPCKHIASIQCHTRLSKEPICCAKINDVLTYPCNSHRFSPANCEQLVKSQYQLANGSLVCPEIINATRYRCGHKIAIACRDEIKVIAPSRGAQISFIPGTLCEFVKFDAAYCDAEESISPCTQSDVEFHRSCGHIIRHLVCSKAFSYNNGDVQIPTCEDLVEISSPLCNHSISPSCEFVTAIQEWNPWEGMTPPILGEVCISFTSSSQVILASFDRPQNLPRDVDVAQIDCETMVTYVRECQHSVIVPCVSAFYKDIYPCDEQVEHIAI